MSNFLKLTKDELNKYETSENIQIGSKKISILFLRDLLSNDEFYQHLENIFSLDKSTFEYGCFEKNSNVFKLLSRMEILKAIEKIIKEEKLMLTDIEESRLKKILKLSNFDEFAEKHYNDIINIEIDGNKIKVKVSDIIDFLKLPDKEYEEFFDLEKQPTIHGIPKEYFVYVVQEYLNSNKIFENYIATERILKIYSDLYRLKKIDIEALNQITSTIDNNIEKVVINDLLRQEILKHMPSNINALEKAIYIYIKLCKTLTYDEEFYVFNQSGKIAEKHEDIDYISCITPQNNKVVCYEFNEIYAKFLEELGINFISYPLYAQTYGGQHARLEFRYEKFLIEVDPLTSIIDSDLLHAKLNQPVNGILCKNENNNTKEEFEKMVSKVYMMVEKDKVVEYMETLEELLEQYNYDSIEIKLAKKVRILLGKLYSSNLIGLDALTYSIQLSKIIFDELERCENININIIKNNNVIDIEQDAMASAVITINQSHVKNNPDQNKYYLYIPGQRLKKIERNDLIKKMENGEFEYSEYDDLKIPGLILKGDCCYNSKVKK